MLTHRRGLLRDRRGISGIAVGALLAIAVLLLYLQFISTLQGAEVAFWAIFGLLKWLAGVLGYPHLFDEFEKFIRELMGTPFWPITVYMLSLAFMSTILYGTLYGTKGIVDITTRILAWRRARREEKRKIREKNEREYKLWKKSLEEDEEPFAILPKFKVASKRKPKALVLNESIIKKEPVKNEKLLETQWWQLRETHVLTLTEGKLSEIIIEAKKRFPTARRSEGSYRGLAKASGMADHKTLFDIVKEGGNSMTVGNLMKLLNALGASYDVLTPYIKSVGGKGDRESIVNPKFPINLNNPDGGRILAASFKDGYINRKYHNFYYINYDPENRRIITEAVQRTFGDIKPIPTFDRDGKQSGIGFTSAVIGDALIKAGAVAGSKVEQDYHLPDMIKLGSYAIRNHYFEQAIRDDGNINFRKYQIYLWGAKEIESKVTPKHHMMLECLPWNIKSLPSQALELYLVLTDELRNLVPDEIKPVYGDLLSKMGSDWIPTIIKEEKETLEKTYGVKARIIPMQIYKGKSGLRGYWEILVQGKDNLERMVRQLDSVQQEGGDEEK